MFGDKRSWTDDVEYDTLIVTCGLIQTALELALKAHLVRESGLASIINTSKSGITEAEWKKCFENNNIWVKEFDQLVHSYKKLGDPYFSRKVYTHEKKEYDVIQKFQNYRNKIFHFVVNIDSANLKEEKKSLLAYVIRVVMYLLFDKYSEMTPDQYFQDLIGYDYYEKLNKCPEFGKAMQKMAMATCNEPWYCPLCGWKTYDPVQKFCYCCQFEFDPCMQNNADCPHCGTSKSVIYDFSTYLIDHPNVHAGYCMACDKHQDIFECPVCGHTHPYYDNSDETCHNVSSRDTICNKMADKGKS